MSSGQVWSKKLSTEIAKAILGQEETIERMFVALLAAIFSGVKLFFGP